MSCCSRRTTSSFRARPPAVCTRGDSSTRSRRAAAADFRDLRARLRVGETGAVQHVLAVDTIGSDVPGDAQALMAPWISATVPSLGRPLDNVTTMTVGPNDFAAVNAARRAA